MTLASSMFLAIMTTLALTASSAELRAQSGVTGLDGRAVAPIDGTAFATVLLFTTTECPISNRYAPAIRRLSDTYAARGIRLWLVYPNAGDSAAEIGAHAAAFLPELPVALDTARTLADRAAATVTPEAALFDRSGTLRYHGRIDDRYLDFGVERPAPTRHDLDNALRAVLDGRPVEAAVTPAVGCAIVRQRP